MAQASRILMTPTESLQRIVINRGLAHGQRLGDLALRACWIGQRTAAEPSC